MNDNEKPHFLCTPQHANTTSRIKTFNIEPNQIEKINELVNKNVVINPYQGDAPQRTERNGNNKPALSKEKHFSKLKVAFNNKYFSTSEALEKSYSTSTQLIRDRNFDPIKWHNSLDTIAKKIMLNKGSKVNTVKHMKTHIRHYSMLRKTLMR